MVRKTGYIEKLLLTTLTLIVSLIISGCGPKPTLATYMRPELLYLNEQPYSQLYVEVDSIEGVEVPDEWLDILKEFLAVHCIKPDGIKIVRDEPIPFDNIKDMPIGPASIFCIDGPDPNSSYQSAYLHVFFYNKKGIFKKAEISSHIISTCPNTIFFHNDNFFIKNRAPCALSHETGHILGLCKNTSHGDGAHCKNINCLMNSTPGLLRDIGAFLGIPVKKSLCEDCMSDLANYKSESADPNLTFDGPFLIRKEDGYSVASLPYCDFIIPQFLEEKFEWSQLLESLHTESENLDYSQYLEKQDHFWFRGIFKPNNEDGSPPDINLLKDSLKKATEDPNPVIRYYTTQELEKLEQKQQK